MLNWSSISTSHKLSFVGSLVKVGLALWVRMDNILYYMALKIYVNIPSTTILVALVKSLALFTSYDTH